VVIRGPIGAYLLLRGRWASGSRHVVGLLLMLGVWLLAGPFCAFDDRTLITNRISIVVVILF
jgi:hypothetical protein